MIQGIVNNDRLLRDPSQVVGTRRGTQLSDELSLIGMGCFELMEVRFSRRDQKKQRGARPN